MIQRKKLPLLAVMGFLGLGSLAAVPFLTEAAGTAGDITPEPIPLPPTPRATIDGWVADNDTTSMRKHAWDLWAAMTSPSQFDATLPIWETWYSPDQLSEATDFTAVAPRTRPSHPFVAPNQFRHGASGLGADSVISDTATQLVAFNKFNGPSGEFIRQPHLTPAGSHNSYLYSNMTDLENLNSSWPASTQTIDRTIVDFPDAAIDLKPVLWLIKATQLTAFPVWQGPSQSTDPSVPSPTTWRNCVLVDPAARSGNPRPVTPRDLDNVVNLAGLTCTKYLQVVPLSMFYSFTMNQEEATAFNTAHQNTQAQTGDHAALAAMHATTKESKNWTWQTFWWQGGQNPPNNFPGGTQDRPSALQSPWNNYAMCTAYSMTEKNKAMGRRVVCFNPYLETNFNSGIQSNCMTCHSRATVPNVGYQMNGVVNFNNPTLFGTSTRLDFVWALNP
jgi:hypothetical protein